MLVVRCRRRDRHVIIGWRRFIELRHRPAGIELWYHCPCGDIEHTIAGRRAEAPPALPPTPRPAADATAAGTRHFLGRPHALYAARYGVPLQSGRPMRRRPRPRVAG